MECCEKKNGTFPFCSYWYTKQRLLRTHWSLYKIALVEPYDMMVEWFGSLARVMKRRAKKREEIRTHKNRTESKGLGSVNDAVFHFHPLTNDNTFMRLWGYEYCCARPTYAFKHTQTNRPIKIMWKLDIECDFFVCCCCCFSRKIFCFLVKSEKCQRRHRQRVNK